MNDHGDSKVATISLRASILGIVIPILIAFLFRIFAKGNVEPYYMLCVLLFAGMELVAVVTGVIGRRTSSGKAGLAISLVCIIVSGGAAHLLSGSPDPRSEETRILQTERSQSGRPD